MPIYEFRCDACASTFEKFQRTAGAANATCPSCGAQARRLLSLFAVPRGASAESGRTGEGEESGFGGHDHDHGHSHSHGFGGHDHGHGHSH